MEKLKGSEFREYYRERTKKEGGGDWVYAWGLKGLPTKIGYTSRNPHKRVQGCVDSRIFSSPNFDIVAFNVTNKPISRGELETRAHFIATSQYGQALEVLKTGLYNGQRSRSGRTEVFSCSVQEASEVIFKALRMTKDQSKEMAKLARLNITRFLDSF